ncbi:MAG: peptide chain release factor 1 [Clostridia bacterium]|nr:peptide chain release factor 1 [Clostridia bacterium]
MIERFEERLRRYEELSEEMVQPETLADLPRYQCVLKERAELEASVLALRRWQDLTQQQRDCAEMKLDPALAALAAEEEKAVTQALAEHERAMRRLLLPPDVNSGRNVILEIRAGTGGEESALFAGDLARMYRMYAQRCRLNLSPVSLSETELGGLKEAVFTVSGNGAWQRFKYESGVHRVQRVPVTESSGRKQTSACTVAILPEAEESELQIDAKDLRIDTYRASGAGGQYVNRTDSAVRITHLPTGLVVTCQDEKSQLRNREQAMKVLRSRLLDRMQAEADALHAEQRRVQVGSGDRSERIRTYNFHEGRVTDHRIGLTLYRLQDVLNGDLDELVTALAEAEQSALLQRIDS